MRTLKYMLIGQTAVPTSNLMEWAEWFESSGEARIVKQETIGKHWVSTVFLGLDHNFLMRGAPILFETMVFRITRKGNKKAIYQDRCSTWLEAEKMHAEAVDKVIRKQFKEASK